MNEDLDIDELSAWLLVPIVLLGLFLRLVLLDVKGLWLDETFSIWLASHPIAGMLHWIVKIDQHPPLYYLLLHYWIAISDNFAYNVRLLSALIGTATIPIIYLIGKRLSGSTTGLAAAVFLALSPFNIFYAQEARMYTLLAFNVAVAIYALVRLLTDPNAGKPIGSQFKEFPQILRTYKVPAQNNASDFSYADKSRDQTGWRAIIDRLRRLPIRAIETDLSWVALIVFSAAAMYSHNTAVLFLFAINVFVLGLMLLKRRRTPDKVPTFQAPSFWNWVKAQIGILILWSPWIYFFIKQASSVDRQFWIPAPTVNAVVWVLKSFLNPMASNLSGKNTATAVWILYGLVLCLGLVRFRKNFSRFLFLLALFAIPILTELIISIRRPIFLDRTLIWVTIPLLLVLAAGIAQLRFRLLIIVMTMLLGFINLFSVVDYQRWYQKEDWYSAAGCVANFAQKDDLVLFNSNFVQIPFDYYFKQFKDKYGISIIERGVPLDLLESGTMEPIMTANDIPSLLSLLNGQDRVWLVYSHNSYTDPSGFIPRTLNEQMKLVWTCNFYGGRVQLFNNP